MTPSKPTVPVSGRVPALPEDITDVINDTIEALSPFDGSMPTTDAVTLRLLAERLHAAGVPGLVQRLTEAEAERDRLREGLRLQGDALGSKVRRLETAELLLRWVQPYEPSDKGGRHDVWHRIDAYFLSVGEGRSREGAGETDE